MLFEKKKNRTRVATLGKDDYFETFSGEKLPIKNKPMIFADYHAEFNDTLNKINKKQAEYEKAIETGSEFDTAAFEKLLTEYRKDFVNIVKIVTEFNGWDVDEEFINNNLGYEDPYWYMNSVSLGRPIYSFDDLTEKKKK